MANPDEKKICILGASFDTNNLGVGVLLASLVKCVKSEFPHARISILDYGKKQKNIECDVLGKKVRLNFIPLRFSIKLFQWNNIVILLGLAMLIKILPNFIKQIILQKNPVLCELMNMDSIGSIAGGDSFADIYGIEQFLYVALPQVLVLLLGKKLVQFPQTYGPFKGVVAKNIARFILKRSHKIFSRDKSGIEFVNNLVALKKKSVPVNFLYDVGFVLDPLQSSDKMLVDFVQKHRDNQLLVGINISGLLYMGGYTKNNMFGLKIDYKEFIEKLILYFIQKYNAHVILVSHVFGTVESDLEASVAVYEKLGTQCNGELTVIRSIINQHEAKFIIGACDFFVGSRMHACIAALSQCIPAVGVAYSKKFIGVLESIGVGDLVVDPCKLSQADCLQRIDQLFSDRNKYKQLLKENIPDVQKEVTGLFHNIELSSAQ